MQMIENGTVKCLQDNEYGNYTVGNTYEIQNGMITDDDGDWTNFGNVRRWFKSVK